MKPKWHILFGFVAAYSLVYFFHFSLVAGLVIFLSSFLIDTDHYFWYALSKKDWNPKNSVNWYFAVGEKWKKLSRAEKDKFQRGVFIFHSLLVLAILFLLSRLNVFFFWIFLGFIIHFFIDWPTLIYDGEPLYLKTFPTYTMIKNKNKKPLTTL